MKPNTNPPINPEHWGPLPFPFNEMNGGLLELVLTVSKQIFKAFLCIERLASDDGLFSVVIVISDVLVDGALAQLRIQLQPSGGKRIVVHPSSDSGFHYRLSIPATSLGHLRFPVQYRDGGNSDGPT
jgi:hypothetical protein